MKVVKVMKVPPFNNGTIWPSLPSSSGQHFFYSNLKFHQCPCLSSTFPKGFDHHHDWFSSGEFHQCSRLSSSLLNVGERGCQTWFWSGGLQWTFFQFLMQCRFLNKRGEEGLTLKAYSLQTRMRNECCVGLIRQPKGHTLLETQENVRFFRNMGGRLPKFHFKTWQVIFLHAKIFLKVFTILWFLINFII